MKSNLEVKTDSKALNEIITGIENCNPSIRLNSRDNLTRNERQALSKLKKTNLVIKKADKGDTLIIMEPEFYRDKLVFKDHLSTDTYTRTDLNADKKVMKNLKSLTKKYSKCLTEKEIKYICSDEYSSSNFYVLPKIHKCKTIIDQVSICNSSYLKMPAPDDLKARPIVAGPNSPTQKLSKLLQIILSPLVTCLDTYIQDDWDFLRKLPRYLEPSKYRLVSFDVTSLYTSIPHSLGEDALKYFLQKYSHLIPSRFSVEFILEASMFVLKNNNFLFDSIMYRQISGTAMGTDFAPPYACLCMGYLEETKLFPELQRRFNYVDFELIIKFLLRYIDDGFEIWPIFLDISFTSTTEHFTTTHQSFI